MDPNGSIPSLKINIVLVRCAQIGQSKGDVTANECGAITFIAISYGWIEQWCWHILSSYMLWITRNKGSCLCYSWFVQQYIQFQEERWSAHLTLQTSHYQNIKNCVKSWLCHQKKIIKNMYPPNWTPTDRFRASKLRLYQSDVPKSVNQKEMWRQLSVVPLLS